MQALGSAVGDALLSACDGDGAPGSALDGAPRSDGALDGACDGAPQWEAAARPSAAKVRGAQPASGAAALDGPEARNVTRSNTAFARRCERWASRREAILQREREVQAAKELEECTFAPKLNAESVWIDANRESSSTGELLSPRTPSRCTGLHHLHTPSALRRITVWRTLARLGSCAGRQRIEDLHRMATRAGWRHPRDDYAGAEALREEEELRHCSFKPHLLSAAHTREAPSGGGSPAEDIARRCERWASRREALLRRERGVQAAKELEDCTFTPNVDLPDSSARAAQAGHSTDAWLILPLHPLAPPTRPCTPS